MKEYVRSGWNIFRLLWILVAAFGINTLGLLSMPAVRASGCSACTNSQTCSGGQKSGYAGCSVVVGGSCQNLGGTCSAPPA